MEEELIYLDNAASSHPKPAAVYEASDRALRLGANPGRSGHKNALDAARLIHDTRELAAELFNAEDSSSIVFTFNASHALNAAIFGYVNPGDHVITTAMEHNSVLRPLHALSERGVRVTVVQADTEGWVDPKEIEEAMTGETTLVCLTHASNVCGTILDVKTVGEACRRRGVALLLDASQTAGTLKIDLAKLKVDMLAAPGHKGLLGPQGTGILYVRPGLELRPFIFGGTGFHSEELKMPPKMPERLEGGTMNTPGIAGLGAGISYLLQRGVDNVRASEELLTADLLDGLSAMDEVELYGPRDAARRVGVVSFNLRGKDGAHVGYVLDEAFSIGVRVGLHCAPQAHRALGCYPSGTVRASVGPFTTAAHIESLLYALRSIIKI